MYRLLISLLIILFHFNFFDCITCVGENTCRCKYTNGSIIDLSNLDSHVRPRFENLKAVEKYDDFTYSYNLCSGFEMGGERGCKDVAVCLKNTTSNEYYSGGNSDSANFLILKDALQIVYSAGQRETFVHLICDEDSIEPKLVVNGELAPYHYQMTLTSKCACPDLCKDGLSAGSVLVILFMIFVVLYLLLGIVHSSLTRGASGWELIPHYEFWADFPLLIKDGCVFVVSACIRRNTSYGSI